MSSLSLSVTGLTGDARRDVRCMSAAMTDRSPAWVDAFSTREAALAVGAETEGVAKSSIQLLSNGIRLAASGPDWIRRELDCLAADLDGEVIEPEVIAAALAGINGDGHCIAADGTKCVVVFRSSMSPRPLFYSVRPGGTVLVSSQIRGIKAARPSTGIDLHGLPPFLVPTMCDPKDTAWQGIRRLPPGYAMIIRSGKTWIKAMPQPESPNLDGACREDYVNAFRQRLLTAIERCSGPSDSILLSGGIDSAALTCAAQVAGLTPRVFSLTYNSPELAACDERRYVDDVEQVTGIPVTRLPADHLLPLLADYPIGDEPEAWTYAARNTAMLQHIARDPASVSTVIAGEGGDELLLGQIFTVADRQARGDADGAASELQTFPNPVAAGKVVDALLAGAYNKQGVRMMRALADIPPWLSDRYVADVGLVDRLAAGYPRLTRPGQLTVEYSQTLISEAGAAGRVHCGGWWEDLGRCHGLHITYPFLDPELASLSWALPPHLLRDNGIEKVILREALTRELPARVARREDKADARAMMHTGLRRAGDQLRAIARSGPLVDHSIVDSAKLDTAIDEYLAGSDHHGPALWATVAVNTWMHHHEGDTQS